MKQCYRCALLLMIFLGTCSTVWAEVIDVKGRITDRTTQEPLVGATIVVEGSSIGCVSDAEGNFHLSYLSEGSCTLQFSYVGYKTGREQVTIRRGETLSLDLQLDPEELVMDKVVVTGQLNREGEQSNLIAQHESVMAIQSVGAKELSRKGVGDAQAALTKVSGISKQEGVKNVFIRGLGDRYNITTLNGFPIPSEDPEYKNVSLDFFSTDLIQTLAVNKAFSAAGQSDVGGAHVDIRSKQLSSQSEVSIGLSGGLNTQTVGVNFLKMDGTGYFGFARGGKPHHGTEQYAFRNRLDPTSRSVPMNHGYGFSWGRQFKVAHHPLSVFVSGSHGNKLHYYHEQVRNSVTTGELSQDQIGSKYDRETQQFVLANLSYSPGDVHHLAYNFMMIHASQQLLGDYVGMDADYQSSDDYRGFMRRQQMNDNLLFVHQLLSEWRLSQKFDMAMALAYNTIDGEEPDRRINNLVRESQGYVPMKGTGVQQRYFANLDENDVHVRWALSYRLPDRFDHISRLRVGYRGRFVIHRFDATEYDLSVVRRPVFDINHHSWDDYYNAENFENGFFKIDRNDDRYKVNKDIHTVFLEATWQCASHLILNLGIKYDDVMMKVDYNVNRGGTQGRRQIDKSYFLPSLNVRYAPTDQHTLRLSVSKTYTLPQPKEISPFRYTGVSFNSQGNPDLRPSDVYNIDLKWDWFFTRSELFSVATFFKHIAHPISRIEIASAGGYLSYENIADHATVAGVEVEFRKNIFSKPLSDDGLHRLSFGLNGSYIYTCADVPLATDKTGSQLEGAAPWIVNADLSHLYRRGKYSFTNTLVFNYFSDRVYTIGTEGYRDIIEHGVPTLDFISRAKVSRHVTLSLKAQNLLDSKRQLTRDANSSGHAVVLKKYRHGIDFSLGVTCQF